MSAFRSLAIEHGGAFRRFSQGRGLRANWREMDTGSHAQKGICGGLSLLFLGLQKMGGDYQLYSGGASTDKGVFKFAERAQQLGGSAVDPVQLENAARHFSLHRESARILCGSANSVAKNCIKSPNGLSMVGFPRHWCAASTKNNVFMFFDPNFGFARFPDSLKFTLFIESFCGLNLYGTSGMDVTWFG